MVGAILALMVRWLLPMALIAAACSSDGASSEAGTEDDTGADDDTGTAGDTNTDDDSGTGTRDTTTGDGETGGDCDVELRDIEFTNEEPITIVGYDLDAMEVDISHDGTVLMWNDREEMSAEDKNLHWASRISDTEFQYEGEVTELNTMGVDGTPSFDENDNLYYVSTGEYPTNGFKSFYRATRNASGVWEPVLLEGLYDGMGFVSVDPDISPNGTYLFYSLFTISGGPLPAEIELRGTVSDGSGGFEPIDDALLADVNTDLLDYAPTISNDGLEMYFTRADPSGPGILGIYKTTRESVDQPFAAVDTTVAAITGVVEAPSFNADETALYYHRKESEGVGVYEVYRVTRSLPEDCR